MRNQNEMGRMNYALQINSMHSDFYVTFCPIWHSFPFEHTNQNVTKIKQNQRGHFNLEVWNAVKSAWVTETDAAHHLQTA